MSLCILNQCSSRQEIFCFYLASTVTAAKCLLAFWQQQKTSTCQKTMSSISFLRGESVQCSWGSPLEIPPQSLKALRPLPHKKRLSGIWKPRNSTNSLRSKHPAEIMSGRLELAVEFQPGFTHQWTQPGVTLQAEPCSCWALCCEGICIFSWGKWDGCGEYSHGVKINLTTYCLLNCFCSQ